MKSVLWIAIVALAAGMEPAAFAVPEPHLQSEVPQLGTTSDSDPDDQTSSAGGSKTRIRRPAHDVSAAPVSDPDASAPLPVTTPANSSTPAPSTAAQASPLKVSPTGSKRAAHTAASASAAQSHGSAAPKSPAAAALERGKSLSRHGLYKEAADFFTRAADGDPKNPEPYTRRARAEWQLEQMKEALEDANYAIKLNPDYANAFCTRAAIDNSTGHYQDAVTDASMARDLNPNLGDAYLIEASAYHNLGQHQEANSAMEALKAVKNPVGAFDEWQPSIDYTSYMTYLEAIVREHWQAPAGTYGPVVPLFKVHRNGNITDLRLNNTTGDANADNAAMNAVKSSAPFRPLPAGAPPDFDVYVVLDPAQRPPVKTANQPAQPAASGKNTNGGAKIPLNLGGTVFSQGIGLMTRFLRF